MCKVRVDLEDLFVENTSKLEDISERYQYTFNSKWIANNSPTKWVAIRKIKKVSYYGSSYFYFSHNQIQIDLQIINMRTYSLDCTKIIPGCYDYLVSQKNDLWNQNYSENNFLVSYIFNYT
ncbi:MAG: hypothetical protein Ta2E_10400 [Mycoplasmoidaceae bacterium]|nr:MAG: hypothetical protein Ta2E_10400 [Mycoplasmoidaceae bacterium]